MIPAIQTQRWVRWAQNRYLRWAAVAGLVLGVAAVLLAYARMGPVEVRPLGDDLPGRLLVGVGTQSEGGPEPTRGTTVWIDPRRGTCHELLPTMLRAARPSPDGRQLAFEATGSLWIQRIDTGQIREIPGLYGAPVWWPDGSAFVCTQVHPDNPPGSEFASSYRVDAENHRRTSIPVPVGEQIFDVTPDGRWFVVVVRDPNPKSTTQQIGLRSTDGIEFRPLTTEGYNLAPRLSPDGRSIAFTQIDADGDGSQTIRIASLDGSFTKDALVAVSGGTWYGIGAGWSPDGRWLVIRSQEWIDVVRTDGTDRRRLDLKIRRPVSLRERRPLILTEPLRIGTVEWVRRPDVED